jgi:hypothetical protein
MMYLWLDSLDISGPVDRSKRDSPGRISRMMSRHMEACSVGQHHESRHDSLATLVSGQSWEIMLASLDPGILNLYSRVDIIGILLEYGTPQAAMWVGREAEFIDHGQDSIAISTLRLEVYSSVGTMVWHHQSYVM